MTAWFAIVECWGHQKPLSVKNCLAKIEGILPENKEHFSPILLRQHLSVSTLCISLNVSLEHETSLIHFTPLNS